MATVKDLGADICPSCNQTMTEKKREFAKNSDNETVINIAFTCDTEGCEWEGTGRAVTTDMRGNVFQRNMGPRGMDKDWPKLSPDALFRGKVALEEILGERIEDDKNLPSFTEAQLRRKKEEEERRNR